MCALETSTSGHAHHKPTASAMWGRGVVREARATLGTCEMLEKKDMALRCDDDPSVHEAPAEKAAAASEGAGDGEVGVVVKS